MDRRPEYVPAAVWRFYRELADKYPEDQPERARLVARLFSPDMARTWRNLTRQIETAPLSPLRIEQESRWATEDDRGLPPRQVTAEQDWRHLLDLLLQLPHTFAPEVRDELKHAEGLLAEIGDTAERLSDLMREYNHLSERHQFSRPEPFTILSEWIKATTGENEPGSYEPAPADMLQSLAFAAWYHETKAGDIDEAFIRDRKPSYIAAFVRHFDALWKRWQDLCFAARFEVSNTDLSRIASAVLRMDVSRETVKQARARTKPQDEGDDEAELLTPD